VWCHPCILCSYLGSPQSSFEREAHNIQRNTESGDDNDFDANVTASFKALKPILPTLPVSLRQDVRLASSQFVAAVIICTEQTFSQASVATTDFAGAFSVALYSYIKSGLRDAVNKAVQGGFGTSHNAAEQLKQIVSQHRLRIDSV